ncbi:MAG TPA: formate dehydrogenase accessory protein FdhE [Vicinamibacterales bacterium]|jgi:FdhE protein
MAHVPVLPRNRADLLETAERRWAAVSAARPDLDPAVQLQRRLISLVIDLSVAIDGGRLPRLSLPAKYIAAKLARGVPALAGEPVPLPVAALTPSVLRLCDALAEGGAGESARHIREAIASGAMEPVSLFTASLARDQSAIRTGASHRGLAPDLVWLVAELAVGPFVHALQQSLFGGQGAAALSDWNKGYCPTCGSWPALAEVVGGHRILRCSFCSMAWELKTYACIYCEESGESFVTAAPDDERKDRRVEVCSACGSYLKTVDLPELSPFPLLAIADLETMDLDVAAMEHHYQRPALKDFAVRR